MDPPLDDGLPLAELGVSPFDDEVGPPPEVPDEVLPGGGDAPVPPSAT